MTKVKICGITNAEDAFLARDLGADFLGFVVEIDNAERSLEKREAKEIFEQAKGSAPLVALTGLNNAKEIAKLCSFLEADAVQLVGKVSSKELVKLQRLKPGLKIMTVVRAKDEKSVEEALLYQRFSDFIVLDSAHEEKLGGTGKKADWSISKKIVEECKTPVFLAGGLNPENVAEAIRQVKPFGVDVSSGVKASDKMKIDLNKLKKFIEAAKK